MYSVLETLYTMAIDLEADWKPGGQFSLMQQVWNTNMSLKGTKWIIFGICQIFTFQV